MTTKNTETPSILRGWEFFTLADAYKPRDPIQYLVSGMIAPQTLNIIYGAPGSLKSMFLADMAASVVSGKEFLPTPPENNFTIGKTFATQKSSVLWVDFDNGKRRSHERFDAAGRAHNLPENAPFRYVSMPHPTLDANNSAFTGALGDYIKSEKIGFVAIDNLGLVSGGIDENSAEMARPMGNLRRMAEDANCAVILIHHQRKSSGGPGRAGDALRGNSAIEASLDLALLIERAANSPVVCVRATKSRGCDVAPFCARFAYRHKQGTYDLAWARFWAEEDPNSGDEETKNLEEAILQTLQGVSLNQSELIAAVKSSPSVTAGKDKIMVTVKQLVANDLIISQNGARNAVVYSAKP